MTATTLVENLLANPSSTLTPPTGGAAQQLQQLIRAAKRKFRENASVFDVTTFTDWDAALISIADAHGKFNEWGEEGCLEQHQEWRGELCRKAGVPEDFLNQQLDAEAGPL